MKGVLFVALLKNDSYSDLYISDGVHFNFNIDWLSFSGNFVGPTPLADPDLSSILCRVYPDFNVFSSAPGRFSFLSCLSAEGIMIFYNQADNSTKFSGNPFHVVFSGQGMKLVRQMLFDDYDEWLFEIDSRYRVGRVDLALDVFNSPRVDFIKRQLIDKNYISVWRNYQLVLSSNQGFTYYFGRRGSESYLRIYDKMAEQASKRHKDPSIPLDPDVHTWVRVELELRSFRTSSNTCGVRLSTGALRAFFHSFLNSHLSISGLPKPSSPSESVNYYPSVDAYVDPIYKKIDWIRRQVVPSLIEVQHVLGPDFLPFLFGDVVSVDFSHTVYKYLLEHFSPAVTAPLSFIDVREVIPSEFL